MTSKERSAASVGCLVLSIASLYLVGWVASEQYGTWYWLPNLLLSAMMGIVFAGATLFFFLMGARK